MALPAIVGTIAAKALPAIKAVGAKALPFLKDVGGKIGEYLPNFLSGLGSSAGSIASGFLSFEQQQKLAEQQFGHNLALQKDAQSWQESMSNTAFQRQVKDLRSAGLNPLLATGMSGASTGSVGASSVGQGSAPSYDFVNSINTASETRRRNKMLNAEIENITSQTESNNASAWRDRKQASLLGEQARNEARNYDLIESMIKKNEADILNSIRLTNANVSQMEANTLSTILANSELGRRERWLRENPGQAQWTRGIGEWTGAFGRLLGGSVSFSNNHYYGRR